MEDTRSKTKAGKTSDFDLIVFVVTAVVEWIDGEPRVGQPIQEWISGLGIRGPEERPFLALVGSPDMWRQGVPQSRNGMDDVRAAAGFDLGVFKEGATFVWPAPHLIYAAMGHFGVWNPARVLVVGNHDLHERAAGYVGAAYMRLGMFGIFTGLL